MLLEQRVAYAARPWLAFYPAGVPHRVEVPVRSLVEAFDEATVKYARHRAVVFYGRAIRYDQLRDQADRFAAALADLGVRRGDRVALYLVNSPQFIIAYFGALKAGATVTPISPMYTGVEVHHQLQDSGARVIVCQDILYENVLKSGRSVDHVIVTGIDEYLPVTARLMGAGRISSRPWGRAGTAQRALQGDRSALRWHALLEKYPPRPPEVHIDPAQDLASLPYTGGTTGQPKGVMLTHYNLLACHLQARAFWPILQDGQEVSLAYLPFYHIYGQVVVMLGGLLQGGTLVLFTTPDIDDILYAMERYGVTVFYGVPTVYEFLKEHEKTGRVDWRRLKLLTCGADTLHETTVRDWERRTGSKIHEGYGMTETSGVSHATPLGRIKVGSFGVPIPNVAAAVVSPDSDEWVGVGEVGELILHGPNMMQGYWNRPEETRRAVMEIDGEKWVRTGDLVSMDEEGYFYFHDRKKDLIKYKGYSVFPKEVEAVLYQHPYVKAAAVVGVDSPKVGQLIKAYVVLQPEARGKISEQEVQAYCAERLAPYKVPKVVEFRGELPKTDVGKVSRRELREELQEEAT